MLRILEVAELVALDARAFARALDAWGVAPLPNALVLEAMPAAGAPGRDEAEMAGELAGDGTSEGEAAGLEADPWALEVVASAPGAGAGVDSVGGVDVVARGASGAEDAGGELSEDVSTGRAELSTDEGTSTGLGAGDDTGASTTADEGTATGCSDVVIGSAELAA